MEGSSALGEARELLGKPAGQLVSVKGQNMPATKTKKSRSSKRELIDTGKDKRYVRRDEKGRFDEVDNQSRSLSQDRRRKAKTVVKAGQGDKGDQKRRAR